MPVASPSGAPTPGPAPEGGEVLAADGLGGWPRKTATSPKPLLLLAFLAQ